VSGALGEVDGEHSVYASGNLVAGTPPWLPEEKLMQSAMTAERLASEVLPLLGDQGQALAK